MSSSDIVVLGGGPVGLATAIALCQLGMAPIVVERRRFVQNRVGETLGGEATPILQRLGIWDAFLKTNPVPFRGVYSAWGSEELVESPSILRPLGEGWHIDRARFEQCLKDEAEKGGAQLQEQVGLPALEREESGIRIHLKGGVSVRARYLIDATGRGATGIAKLREECAENHYLSWDRQVAVVGRYQVPGSRIQEPVLYIESVKQGWWYTAPQPENGLLVCYLTDADLLSPMVQREASFAEDLSKTRHIHKLLEGASLLGPPQVVRAECGRLVPDRGPGYLAVGDAAFAGDPLSGDGLVRGLRAALQAAKEVVFALSSDVDKIQAAVGRDVGDGFRRYLAMRSRYYSMETRWPDSLYWLRRRTVMEEAPITLSPQTWLTRAVWQETDLHQTLAPLEAYAPVRALRAVLEKVEEGCPAHQALFVMKAAAPIGDRRLLLTLERMCADGLIHRDKTR